MVDVVHDTNLTSQTRLEEIHREVYEAIDRMCLRLGALLFEARSLDPAGFEGFVDTLPFGLDKARRLIGIHLAYSELPDDVIAELPRPWRALYELHLFPQERIIEAVRTGEIGPDTTVRQARRKRREWSSNRPGHEGLSDRHTTADLRAGALMDCPSVELTEPVRRALLRWLEDHPTSG